MPSRERYSEEEVIEALREAKGNVRRAARLLGCGPSTVVKYSGRHEAIAQVRREMVAQRRSREAEAMPAAEPSGKRGRPEGRSIEAVIRAIRLAHGVKAHAALLLGCSRDTVNRYIQRHPPVAAAWREARNTLLDNAESALARAIDRDAPWAVQFALKTLGRTRGYTERHDQFTIDYDPEMDETDSVELQEFMRAIEEIYGPQDEPDERA